MPLLDAYLVSESGSTDALTVGSRLRAEGVAVDFDTEGKSVKAQFRAAKRSGAPVTLVWKGDDPVDVQSTGERQEIPLAAVASWLEDRR